MSLNIVKIAIENRLDVILPASISIAFLAWLSWRQGEKPSINLLLTWVASILAIPLLNKIGGTGLDLYLLSLFIIFLISANAGLSAEVVILCICIPSLFITYMYNLLIFNNGFLRSFTEIFREFQYYFYIFRDGDLFDNFGDYWFSFFIGSGLTNFWYLCIAFGLLIKIFAFKRKKMSRPVVFLLAVLVFVAGLIRVAGYSVYEYSEEYGLRDTLH